MIGQLVRPDTGAIVATLEDSQQWSATEELRPVAAVLNAAFDPLKSREVGDTHLPPGIAAMNRAAEHFGFKVVTANPIPDLPEGELT